MNALNSTYSVFSCDNEQQHSSTNNEKRKALKRLREIQKLEKYLNEGNKLNDEQIEKIKNKFYWEKKINPQIQEPIFTTSNQTIYEQKKNLKKQKAKLEKEGKKKKQLLFEQRKEEHQQKERHERKRKEIEEEKERERKEMEEEKERERKEMEEEKERKRNGMEKHKRMIIYNVLKEEFYKESLNIGEKKARKKMWLKNHPDKHPQSEKEEWNLRSSILNNIIN